VLTRAHGWPAALVVADVDGDKKGELVALIDDVVFTWSADGKLKHRVELSVAPSTHPTREPFGLITYGAGKLQVWSSRREKAELFSWTKDGFKSLGPSDGVTLYTIALTPRPGFASFAPQLQWAGKSLTWPEPLQSLSSFGPMVLAVGPTGNAAIARGVAPSTLLAGLGAGTTLADLDGDGTPEVIATGPRTTFDGDELKVMSLGAFESAQARNGNATETTPLWVRKVEGRVLCGGAGDLDGDGVDEVVFGSWLADGSSEFTVVRGSP